MYRLLQSVETKAIISNKLIIAVNQDKVALPVNRVKKIPVTSKKGEVDGNIQIWSGPLVDGCVLSYKPVVIRGVILAIIIWVC